MAKDVQYQILADSADKAFIEKTKILNGLINEGDGDFKVQLRKAEERYEQAMIDLYDHIDRMSVLRDF